MTQGATPKISSVRAATQEEAIRSYRELYQDPAVHIRTKLKWRGANTLTYQLLRKQLPGKRVVDLGCGLGRVVLLCSREASHVTGVEFEDVAVNTARTLQASLGAVNVKFVHQDLAAFRPAGAEFDVVVLSGVLRHLVEPRVAWERAAELLAPNGTFVLVTSLENNFRGSVSDAFRTLLQWPMSLNDFHTATDEWLRAEAPNFGFKVEKVLGTHYNYAWAEMASVDLKQRLTNVLIDIRDQVKSTAIDKNAFDAWLETRGQEGRAFVEELHRRRILKRIPKRASFRLDPADLQRRGLSADAVSAIQEYMEEDFSRDPYYSDVYPFSLMGGNAIYLLKKMGS